MPRVNDPDPTGRVRPGSARPASYSRVSLAEIARLPQANVHGTLHGGEILKMADSAAGVASRRHCGMTTVTRAIEGASFEVPVEVGSLVYATASVVSTGRTSIRVSVLIENEPLSTPTPGERTRVAEVVFVMVAIGEDGRPVPVPGLAEEPDQPVGESAPTS